MQGPKRRTGAQATTVTLGVFINQSSLFCQLFRKWSVGKRCRCKVIQMYCLSSYSEYKQINWACIVLQGLIGFKAHKTDDSQRSYEAPASEAVSQITCVSSSLSSCVALQAWISTPPCYCIYRSHWHVATHTRTQGQICDVVRLPGKVTWMSSQVGANIGLLSAPFFRLLLCLGICPTQPSLTAVSAILPLQLAKEEWDAQTKDRWSIVLWKLVKTKPFIYMVLKCNGDLEQHPSWSPPSFAFDGFPWSCTIIDEMVLIDRPSEYYLLSNRVILSLQLTGAIRSTTSD